MSEQLTVYCDVDGCVMDYIRYCLALTYIKDTSSELDIKRDKVHEVWPRGQYDFGAFEHPDIKLEPWAITKDRADKYVKTPDAEAFFRLKYDIICTYPVRWIWHSDCKTIEELLIKDQKLGGVGLMHKSVAHAPGIWIDDCLAYNPQVAVPRPWSTGETVEDLHGYLYNAFGVAYSDIVCGRVMPHLGL